MKRTTTSFSPRGLLLMTGMVILITAAAGLAADTAQRPVEGTIDPFLGEAKFELQQLFTGARLPNVVVATDGTVLATWGASGGGGDWWKKGFQVRRSEDGGATWKDLAISKVLPDGARGKGSNGCLAGLVRLPVRGRDIILYSNCDNATRQRKNVTVWASFDGAKTWPIKRSVYAGPSAYSSLSAGRPGTPSAGWAYILLEGGKKHRYGGAQFARFNLSWLLKGKKTGDGKLPKWINAPDSKKP